MRLRNGVQANEEFRCQGVSSLRARIERSSVHKEQIARIKKVAYIGIFTTSQSGFPALSAPTISILLRYSLSAGPVVAPGRPYITTSHPLGDTPAPGPLPSSTARSAASVRPLVPRRRAPCKETCGPLWAFMGRAESVALLRRANASSTW